MRKFLILVLIIISVLTTSAKNESKDKKEHITENMITSQPYKVELIDNKTSQTQNTITLKVANDVSLTKLEVGQKILFTLPSNVNLEDGTIIKLGTKFSATVVLKDFDKIKIIINEIIFDDTTNFIILSNPKGIESLKTISAERILGKYAKITGTYRIGTEISSVSFLQRGIKAEPDTTTAVGICIKIKTIARKLKAGTSVIITFEKNIKPEVMLLK